MRFIDDIPEHDLTYSDVFLVPSRSDVGSRMSVDLSPDDGTRSTLPIVTSYLSSSASTSLSFTRSYGNVICSANTNTTSANTVRPTYLRTARVRGPTGR